MAQYDWISDIGKGGPAQASIEIKIDPTSISHINGRLKPYKNFPSKFAPALAGVADYITHVAIPRTFKQEGPGWKKLSRRTQRERAAAGYNPQHPILVRTGDLFKELTDKSHPKHVEVITVGPSARVVIGGSSEKFIRNQAGNKFMNIPARPMIPGTGFVPLRATDQERLKKIITDAIEAQLHA